MLHVPAEPGLHGLIPLLIRISPFVMVDLGLELLLSVASAQLAAYGFYDVAVGAETTSIEAYAYIGAVWNLWNADDYAGLASSSGFNAAKWGGEVFFDPSRRTKGPYGFAVMRVLWGTPGFTIYSVGYYEMLWKKDYDNFGIPVLMAMALLAGLGLYIGGQFGPEAGLFGFLIGSWLGALWGVVKDAWLQEHNITLNERQKKERPEWFQTGLFAW